MYRVLFPFVPLLSLSDLVRVDWFDASIGKSLSGGVGGIDVPVCSRGVFVGVLGENDKHIILAQNSFRYGGNLYDIDYRAVPTFFGYEADLGLSVDLDSPLCSVLLDTTSKSGHVQKAHANHHCLKQEPEN